jgi:hypothetical protein
MLATGFWVHISAARSIETELKNFFGRKDQVKSLSQLAETHVTRTKSEQQAQKMPECTHLTTCSRITAAFALGPLLYPPLCFGSDQKDSESEQKAEPSKKRTGPVLSWIIRALEHFTAFSRLIRP